ncbi:Nuclear pore complex protein Nup54 [Zostera marina]|uniref:Nuclear pore complex protein Nup54 n=2 Tax=Zostera marina TaxID=29655 RepID=A0A0K9P482_ZOSMR|nr:Nuclear pore complex protein Nup54 [Zostera marina]
MFGTPSTTPAFGTPSSTPTFGTPGSTSLFGTPGSTPAFGTPSSTPAFATPSTSLFSTPNPSSTPTFATPFSTPASSSLFASPSPSPFGFQLTNVQQQQQIQQPQQQKLTTQMATVAPFPLPLVDRDVMAIVDAYKDEPGNPKHSFRHLLLSVTDPATRVKPLGVSDIMWAEAMGKLEGMESADRERLWPQLVQGFKDLSHRLKLQDEVIISDGERLKKTQTNVKLLQRHCQADTLPWIHRLKLKEQNLQRRLLRLMRIIETLEGRGLRLPLMRGEAELVEKSASITRQLKGARTGLSVRVHNLLSISRIRANAGDGGSICLPGSTKIDEQSLFDLHEVLQQQTGAISRLWNVLMKDIRDSEIIMAEDTEMEDNDI